MNFAILLSLLQKRKDFLLKKAYTINCTKYLHLHKSKAISAMDDMYVM